MIVPTIKAQNLSYEEEVVEVIFVKPCSAIKVAEEVIGPFNEGVETTLPRWIAKTLAENGIIKIKQDTSRNLVELSKSAWREERSDTLLPVDEDFYPRLRNYLRELKLKADTSPTQQLINELRQADLKAKDLINCRLQKIVRIALDRTPPKNLIDNMAAEEKALFNSIRELIEVWRSHILDVE